MRKIQELRKSLNMSQSQFADYFGLNVRTLQSWERGRANPPEYLIDMIEQKISENLIYTDLKETKSKTKTYEYRDDFFVDIVDNEDVIEVYLYHRNYDIKALLFGLDKKDINTEEELKELITSNLDNETYIENYIEEYMGEKDYQGETMMDIYNRILNNCKFYEKEDNKNALLNEIGVLRGIAYCLQTVGVFSIDAEFEHFINIQEELVPTD